MGDVARPVVLCLAVAVLLLAPCCTAAATAPDTTRANGAGAGAGAGEEAGAQPQQAFASLHDMLRQLPPAMRPSVVASMAPQLGLQPTDAHAVLLEFAAGYGWRVPAAASPAYTGASLGQGGVASGASGADADAGDGPSSGADASGSGGHVANDDGSGSSGGAAASVAAAGVARWSWLTVACEAMPPPLLLEFAQELANEGVSRAADLNDQQSASVQLHFAMPAQGFAGAPSGQQGEQGPLEGEHGPLEGEQGPLEGGGGPDEGDAGRQQGEHTLPGGSNAAAGSAEAAVTSEGTVDATVASDGGVEAGATPAGASTSSPGDLHTFAAAPTEAPRASDETPAPASPRGGDGGSSSSGGAASGGGTESQLEPMSPDDAFKQAVAMQLNGSDVSAAVALLLHAARGGHGAATLHLIEWLWFAPPPAPEAALLSAYGPGGDAAHDDSSGSGATGASASGAADDGAGAASPPIDDAAALAGVTGVPGGGDARRLVPPALHAAVLPEAWALLRRQAAGGEPEAQL